MFSLKQRRGSIVRVPQRAWYGDTKLELRFPRRWDVDVRKMIGHSVKPISDTGIKQALAKPIGTKTIAELASGKKEAVIIFDDIYRPTPIYRIAPFVLDELAKGGIKEDHIRFVGANGAHRLMDRADFLKKLGEEIVKKFYVFNHNVYDHAVELGKTSRGTPVAINEQVMECDLKIGIGVILPGRLPGFGGGGKIILPGVSSIDTIEHNHICIAGCGPGMTAPETVAFGRVKDNVMLLDVEETARMAGLEVKIDAVLNSSREIVGLFAGDPVLEHRNASAFAKKIYTTEPAKNMDIVVSNAYPLEHEPFRGYWTCDSVKPGGDVVIIDQGPSGILPSYMYGRFGMKFGGRGWFDKPNPVTQKAKRIIVFSEEIHRADELNFGGVDRAIFLKSWREVIEELSNSNPEKAKVTVYPYSTMQCPPFPEDW